jgi:hypothetical protein
MKIEGATSILLAVCVGFVLWLVAHVDGGFQQLTSTNALILIFALSFPFIVLWAAANGAKGKIIPRVTIVISIAFILFDTMINIGPGSRLSESVASVVMAAIASLEVILPLSMVGFALVSRARWEGNEASNDDSK